MEAQFDRVVDTNLKGASSLCQAAAQTMINQKSAGRIIKYLLLSHEDLPSSECPPLLLQRWPAHAHAHDLPWNWLLIILPVNNIAPALSIPSIERRCQAIPKKLQALLDEIPLHRWATEEIGPLALYLASDASSYVTGSTFTIDGGLCITLALS